MRTNGGCQCLVDLPSPVRLAARRLWAASHSPPEDGCPNCGHAWHAEKGGHCTNCDCRALERKAKETKL